MKPRAWVRPPAMAGTPPTKTEPICETMERLGYPALCGPAGRGFVYGYNTDILGCVVEKASGMPLDEFRPHPYHGPARPQGHAVLLPGRRQRERLAAVYASAEATSCALRKAPKARAHYVDGPRKSFAGGAGLAFHGPRLCAFSRDDPQGRRTRRRPHPRTAHRRLDDHQSERHASLHHRPGLRLRLRNRGSVRSQEE